MVRKMREYKKSSDPANLTHIKRTTYLREADMVEHFPLEEFQNSAFYTKYGHDGRFVGFRDIQEYVNELPEDGLNNTCRSLAMQPRKGIHNETNSKPI